MDRVTVIYVKNPFDPYYSREFSSFAPGKTISEIAAEVCPLDKLSEYEIVASVNGCEFLPDKGMDFVPVAGDTLAFAAVPGKSTGKMIASIVMMIVIMIVAPELAGAAAGYVEGSGTVLAASDAMIYSSATALAYGATYGAVVIAGGLIMSALAPKPPSLADAEASASATYSWNPSGNYYLEGAALPELFGTHRIIPPVISKHITLVGDKQTLNLLFAIAGHEIESISSVRINEQPADQFAGIGIWGDVALGTPNQPTIPEFDDIRSEASAGPTTLSSDAFVKAIQAASNGNPCVVTINSHGFSDGESVMLTGLSGGSWGTVNHTSYEINYIDPNSFQLLGLNASGLGAFGGGYVSRWTKKTMGVSETADSLGVLLALPRGLFHGEDDGSLSLQSVRVALQFRLYNAGNGAEQNWNNVKQISGTTTEQETAGHWEAGGYMGGRTWQNSQWSCIFKHDPIDTNQSSHFDSDGRWVEEGKMFEASAGSGPIYYTGAGYTHFYFWRWVPANTDSTVIVAATDYLLIEGKSASPTHEMAYWSPGAVGRYEIRACMYDKPVIDTRNQGQVDWAAYMMILNSEQSYPGTALLGVKMLASDQLSGGMPKIDCIVKRGGLWIRNASDQRVWMDDDVAAAPSYGGSTNPAWAVLYLLQRDGKGVPYDRCDYPAFLNWAAYCKDATAPKKAYTCNIYLDSIQTLRRQLDTVSLLGRGIVVQMGSKFSVLVDKTDPATQNFSFGMGNIIKDSYSEEYFPLDDRANAIEVTFFDKNLEYQRSAVELYADDFDTTLRPINKTSVTLIGCTERNEAIAYAKYLLNSNRYITQVASWEASVDAIACIPGDIVSVSHDLPQYGFSGRVVGYGINRVSNSEDFTAWAMAGVTVQTKQTSGPDGQVRADRATVTGAGAHYVWQQPGCSPNTDVYTASIWIRKDTAVKFWLRLMGHDGANWTLQETVIYNFDTGEMTLEHGSTGNAAYMAHGAEPDVGGWVRLWIAGKSGTGTNQHQIAFDPSYQAAAGGSFVWGGQVHKGQGPGVYARSGANPSSGVTLDRSVTILPAVTHQISVRHQATDVVETRDIITDPGGSPFTTATVETAWWDADPTPHANYAFGEINKVSKKFRVMNISRAHDLVRKITAVEYNPTIYAESAVAPGYDDPSGLPGTANLILSEIYSGGTTTGISARWSGNALQWYVWTQIAGEPIYFQGSTTKNHFEIYGLTFGIDVTVYVWHGTSADEALFQTIHLSGKGSGGGVPPLPTPTVFDDARCSFKDMIYLFWYPVDEALVAGHEIRYGASWEAGTFLYRGNGTSFVWNAFENSPSTTTYTFFIKTIDTQGQYSATSDSIVLSVAVPAAPSGVTVQASYGKILVSWTPINDPNVVGVEVYRATTNQRPTPPTGFMGEIGGNVFVDTNNIIGGTYYFYWLRGRTRFGTFSNWSAGDTSGHTGGQTPYVNTDDIANNAISQIKLASDIIPPTVVTYLPALPDAAYPIGKIVYLTTNGKLYRNRNNAWTAEIAFPDIEMQSTDNMFANSRFDNGSSEGWNLSGDWTIVDTGVNPGGPFKYAMMVNLKPTYTHAYYCFYGRPVRVVGGTTYYFSMDYIFSSDALAGAYTNIYVQYFDKNGNLCSPMNAGATTGLYKVTSWTKAEIKLTVPADCDFIMFMPYYYSASAVGQLWITNVFMKRAIETELIVDGAIKSAQIDTNVVNATHIVSDCIQARHLVVADFSNMISNPTFRDGDSTQWAKYLTTIVAKGTAGVPANAPTDYVAKIGGTNGYVATPYTTWYDCTPGEEFYAGIMCASDAAVGAGVNLFLRWFDKDGTYFADTSVATRSGTSQPWALIDGIVTAPANARRFALLVLHAGSGGYWYFTQARLRKAAGATLIVDGAIKADHLDINSVVAGKIAAAAVGADELAANIIAAKHMVIADFSNMVMNPTFEGGAADRWTLFNSGVTAFVRAKGYAGVPANCPTDYCLELKDDNVATPYARTELMNVAAGETIYLSAFVASKANTLGTVYLYILGYDKDDQFWFQSLATRTGSSQPWSQIKGIYTVPANAKTVQFGVQNQSGTGSGSWFVCQPRMRRAANAELIVDGAITAEKIQAGAIVASKMAITGGGATLNLDPLMTDVNTWATYYPAYPPNLIDITDAPVGTRVLQGRVPPDNASNHYGAELVPLTPTKTYRISGFARKTASGSNGDSYLGVACYDQARQWITSGPPYNLYTALSITSSLATSWQRFTRIIQPSEWPTGTRFGAAFCIAGHTATVGFIQFCDVRLEEVVPGELIVNGGISAQKLSFSDLAGLNAAEGAKLSGIAAGATVNRVTYSGSAPGSPVDGDIWVDTSTSPDTVRIRVSGAWQEGATLGALAAQIADISNAQLTGQSVNYGKMLHRDPRFINGTNGAGVYNNYGGGAVICTRVTPQADSPNNGVTGAKDYQITYYTGTPPYSSPGWGGFCFMDPTRPNQVIISKIVAKIPVGRSIAFATNSAGDGYGEVKKWLTPVAGTGRYEEYIFYLKCGTSGFFQSTNFYYITGGSDSTFSWYVSFATTFDLTDVDGAQDGVTLQNINGGLSLTGGGLTLASGGAVVKSGNFAYPDGANEGVGFQLAADGSLHAYGGSHVFGGNFVTRYGNYMVTMGLKLNPAYVSTHWPPVNSTYFTFDGQVHVYRYVTALDPDQWVEICSIGTATVGSDSIVLKAATVDGDADIAIYGYSPDYCGVMGGSENAGVMGLSNYGVGVVGTSQFDYGGQFYGGKAPLLLSTTGSSTPPSHTAQLGSIVVGDDGTPYINVTSGSGYSAWRTLGCANANLNSYALANGSMCTYTAGGSRYMAYRSGGNWDVQMIYQA